MYIYIHIYIYVYIYIYIYTYTHTQTRTQGDSIRTEHIQQFIIQQLLPPGDRNAIKFQDPMSVEGGKTEITVAIQFCAY